MSDIEITLTKKDELELELLGHGGGGRRWRAERRAGSYLAQLSFDEEAACAGRLVWRLASTRLWPGWSHSRRPSLAAFPRGSSTGRFRNSTKIDLRPLSPTTISSLPGFLFQLQVYYTCNWILFCALPTHLIFFLSL